MRLLEGVVVAGALLSAASASAQLRPSPLGDIYASYVDCFKVATKDGLKPDVLTTLGWSRATVEGQSAADKPIFFGRSDRAPLILLSAEQGQGLCIVLARLEDLAAFENFKSAWGGKLPQPDKDGVIYFRAEGHLIRLQRTGTAKEPNMTIAVQTPVEQQ